MILEFNEQNDQSISMNFMRFAHIYIKIEMILYDKDGEIIFTASKREGNKRYLVGLDDIKIRVPKGRCGGLKEIAKEKFDMAV